MNRNHVLWLALVLVGCQPGTAIDTVESLRADPARLKEVQRQCRLERDSMGDAVCNAATEAFRRRFMGDERRESEPEQL